MEFSREQIDFIKEKIASEFRLGNLRLNDIKRSLDMLIPAKEIKCFHGGKITIEYYKQKDIKITLGATLDSGRSYYLTNDEAKLLANYLDTLALNVC